MYVGKAAKIGSIKMENELHQQANESKYIKHFHQFCKLSQRICNFQCTLLVCSLKCKGIINLH